MRRFLLPFAAILGAVALGSVAALAEDEKATNSEEVFIKEVQAEGQAWQYSGVKLPKGYTATISATGTWGINETWDKKVGPGGNPEYKASDAYVKSGATEGCLLVRVGDTILAFSKDDEVIRVSTPGAIYFCANDVPTSEGLAKAELFLEGIPIQPAKDAHGSGYQDNDGVIKVRVAVSMTKKETSPKKGDGDK
ncbi:MAG TPA: hypothetical protein VG122_03560 [Gemmata sp.]|jgi:hypothetical protein|nr:hypothetical protein [Gemmata sp.]